MMCAVYIIYMHLHPLTLYLALSSLSNWSNINP